MLPAWLNNCVGHFNHRYFFSFCLYMTLGCIYCSISSRDLFVEAYSAVEVRLGSIPIPCRVCPVLGRSRDVLRHLQSRCRAQMANAVRNRSHEKDLCFLLSYLPLIQDAIISKVTVRQLVNKQLWALITN